MPWETLRFTREELYRLVWAQPAQHVARVMGVSDVALGKTCRRMGIPVPGRGYWARKAAGEQLSQPPLPQGGPEQDEVYSARRWNSVASAQSADGGEVNV